MLLGIGVGPLFVDFLHEPTAGQHIHNPNWPPHAKFHDAQYIAMSPLVSAIGLRILFRRHGDAHAQLREAAALASVAWLGMWGALLLPGTAATDPEFEATEQRVAGAALAVVPVPRRARQPVRHGGGRGRPGTTGPAGDDPGVMSRGVVRRVR